MNSAPSPSAISLSDSHSSPHLLADRSILTLWNISFHSTHLELLAAEKGAPAKLLDAMCNGADWPPSLRDMAGGCLGECEGGSASMHIDQHWGAFLLSLTSAAKSWCLYGFYVPIRDGTLVGLLGMPGFFAERYSNLAGCFPPLDLPKEVMAKWPLQASAGGPGPGIASH